jgi:hypothetical protein
VIAVVVVIAIVVMMVMVVIAPATRPIAIAAAQRQPHGEQPRGDDHFRDTHHASPYSGMGIKRASGFTVPVSDRQRNDRQAPNAAKTPQWRKA